MSETESDEDLMSNNGLQYNYSRAFNGNMTNFNNPNLTSYTFRNNMKTYTFNTADLHIHRDGMRGFDQRSMYYRRETSPMSLRSFPASRIQYGTSSQRSVYNGRGASPVSMRSIDSNASCVTAKDIVSTIKNAKFNKYDFRIIKEACNREIKKRLKRIEKKRKLRLFLKGGRQRSDDSSDSSLSSDDCRSTRTFYKENIPMIKTLRSDLVHFRNTVRESDMVKDCTEDLRQNSLKNKFTVNNTINYNHTINNNHTSVNNWSENTSTFTLKDRFAKGSSFLLPSQRFNKSVAKLPSNQTLNGIQKNNIYNKTSQSMPRNIGHETDSDNEDIFPDVTIRENTQPKTQRKRLLENDDDNSSAKKRNKVNLSPIKHNDTQQNDFDFKKPQMPLKKLANVKKNAPEVLIAKSRQPLTGSLDLDLPISNKSSQESNLEESQNSNHKTTDLPVNSTEISDSHKDISQSSEVSMRPSFIKRKLFTQKLDVAEKKNTSSDNLGVNSPQTKLYSEIGEKNRVRKLVTSQSCLSRDVLGDNNVLDLIHKIVPPDKMNITNVSNKKEPNKSNRDSQEKWDVTSVISMCNENDGSDTYTDEEIFKAPINISKKANTKEITVNKKPEKATEVINKPKISDGNKITTQCKIVVEKLQPELLREKIQTNNLTSETKRTVSMCVKSFWDTDFESDMEDKSGLPWKYRQAQKANNTVAKDPTATCPNFNLNSTRNASKGTILTVKSFQNRGFNSSRSDISRVSKRKDPNVINNQEQKENSTKQIQNKNSKSKQNNSDEKKPEAKNAKAKKDAAKSNETVKTTNKEHKETTVNTKEKNNNTVKKKETKTTKTKKDTKSSEKSKTKNEEKPITKEKKMNNTQNSNELNISRTSLRLKQKKEQANLTNDTPNSKKLRPTKKYPEKEKQNVNKSKQSNNKKPKEISKKDTKMVKTPSIKNSTLNRTRQTPRKFAEKQIHLTDNSSLNISNISNRSLRTRRNIAK